MSVGIARKPSEGERVDTLGWKAEGLRITQRAYREGADQSMMQISDVDRLAYVLSNFSS